MAKISLSARFWQSVAKAGADECWLWKLAIRATDGYGSFRGEGRQTWIAHRLAWVLTNGPIPDGLSVLHKCDNRACCNPAHLFLGTQLDNVRDMIDKGRAYRRLGSETGVAKMTPETVREIRRRYVAGNKRGVKNGPTMRQLAQQYGVTSATISDILSGQRWDWIE